MGVVWAFWSDTTRSSPARRDHRRDQRPDHRPESTRPRTTPICLFFSPVLFRTFLFHILFQNLFRSRFLSFTGRFPVASPFPPFPALSPFFPLPLLTNLHWCRSLNVLDIPCCSQSQGCSEHPKIPRCSQLTMSGCFVLQKLHSQFSICCSVCDAYQDMPFQLWWMPLIRVPISFSSFFIVSTSTRNESVTLLWTALEIQPTGVKRDWCRWCRLLWLWNCCWCSFVVRCDTFT